MRPLRVWNAYPEVLRAEFFARDFPQRKALDTWAVLRGDKPAFDLPLPHRGAGYAECFGQGHLSSRDARGYINGMLHPPEDSQTSPQQQVQLAF